MQIPGKGVCIFCIKTEKKEMSILKKIIRTAAPLPKIEEMERFLFIGPHPDDIEIGAGATAAKLAAAGKKVCFLICTDGRFGTSNSPELSPEEMAEIRKRESIASAASLGVEDVRFLGLSDGGLYKKKELPFGPFLALGLFIVFLFKNGIANFVNTILIIEKIFL